MQRKKDVQNTQEAKSSIQKLQKANIYVACVFNSASIGTPADAVFNYMIKGAFFPRNSLQRGRVAQAPGVPYLSQVATLSLMTPVEQSSACDLGLTSPYWIMNDKVQCSAVPPVAPCFPLTTFMYISFMGPSVFHTDWYRFLLIQYLWVPNKTSFCLFLPHSCTCNVLYVCSMC